jgi:hypothetical protein
MGQVQSFDDAGYAIVTPAAGVPMLDWPRDLFSDNASPADLEMVDFLLQCDPAFLPHAQHSEDLSIQLAA